MKHKSKTIARRVSRRPKLKSRRNNSEARPQSPVLSWTRCVEQATLDHIPGDITEAERTFQSLAMEEKALLLQEIANTRAVELCRAYPEVIAVSFGFRRRQDKQTGRDQIEQEACIKLLVKRKWRSGVHNPRRELPKHVFTYWAVDGVRHLCAAPTDIEDSRKHMGARPHAPEGVIASTGVPPVESGVLTCAIKRSNNQSELFAMSCKHVFSPMRSSSSNFHLAEVRIENSGQSVGITVDVSGLLSSAARRSLDSQLAKVENLQGLRAALGNVKLDGYVRSEGEAMSAATLWIVTASKGPIRASINAFRHEEFSIDYGDDGRIEDIRHEEVIELQTDNPTRGGDSGSPILTKDKGGLLVGMLIAGPPNTVSTTTVGTLSYAIPAWHLFEPRRYQGAELTETWQLTSI